MVIEKKLRAVKMLMAAVVLCLCYGGTALAGIVSHGPLITAEYWQQKNEQGNRPVLTPAQIEAYNKSLIANRTSAHIEDMASFPEVLEGSEVKRGVTDYSYLNQVLYANDQRIYASYRNRLKLNTNPQQVPEQVKVQYGIVTRHTDLRNLPTAQGLFSSPGDVKYDNLQDSTIEPGEPVAILHQSRDKSYYYVQMYNLRAWVASDAVALCDRSTWEKYIKPEHFLVVTDKDYSLEVAGESRFMLMGSKILLQKEKRKYYQVLVPTRDEEGRLKEEKLKLLKTPRLHVGYLPYTSNNAIGQAFKFYGNVYGWGGVDNSVDCSALVDAVYRTMGLDLPRNTGSIRICPGTEVNFEGLSHKQRLAVFDSLLPGSTVNIKGHVMLYLGSENGLPYVIHAASSHYVNGKKQYVRRVLVSDLNLRRASGKTFLDTIIRVKTFDEG